MTEDLIWFSEAVGVNSRRSMFVLGVGGLLDLHKNSINQNAAFCHRHCDVPAWLTS